MLESVSPSHREHRKYWNQCSRHPQQSWTSSRHHEFWENHLLALCAIFPQQVAPFCRDMSGRVFLPLYRVARSIGRTEFSLQLTNILFGNGLPRSIFNQRSLGKTLQLVLPSQPNSLNPTNLPTGWCSIVEPSLFNFPSANCLRRVWWSWRRRTQHRLWFGCHTSFSWILLKSFFHCSDASSNGKC